MQLLLDPKHYLLSSVVDYEAAMLEAAGEGYADVVELLLQKGHTLSTKDLMYRNPCETSRRGHDTLVHMMLHEGLSIDRSTLGYPPVPGFRFTALHTC